MKQPKFKGFNKEEGRWFYGHGWFLTDYTEEYKKERGIDDQACLYVDDGAPISCELASMGTGIGLVDKDGTDIYTGDIYENPNGGQYEIRYNPMCAIYEGVGINRSGIVDLLSSTGLMKGSVVGTMYERNLEASIPEIKEWIR